MALLISNMKRLKAEHIPPQKRQAMGKDIFPLMITFSASKGKVAGGGPSTSPSMLVPLLRLWGTESTLRNQSWENAECHMLGTQQAFKDCSRNNKSSTWKTRGQNWWAADTPESLQPRCSSCIHCPHLPSPEVLPEPTENPGLHSAIAWPVPLAGNTESKTALQRCLFHRCLEWLTFTGEGDLNINGFQISEN